MRVVKFPLAAILLALVPTLTHAQRDENTKANALRGCWTLDAGTFHVSGTARVDPGQTTLPPLIQFDTVRGRSLKKKPIGHLVRGLAGKSGANYRDGYFTFPHADTIRIDWTTGFTGMSLTFPFDTVVMRGRAEAWTDYGASERATVTIRRSACQEIQTQAAAAHDLIAAQLKIQPLRRMSLASGSAELRLSTGGGMIFGAEYGVLRLVQTPSGVIGEVWRYRGVKGPGKSATIKARRVGLNRHSDLKALLARLDSLDVDQLDVPLDSIFFSDVGELYVESLRGSQYRSVAINAPRMRKGESARRAAEVALVVDSVIAASEARR